MDQWIGRWWVPETPTLTVAGVLEWEEADSLGLRMEGMALELYNGAVHPTTIPTLYGLTNSHGPVSLFGLHEAGFTFGAGSEERYQVQAAVLNAHVPSLDTPWIRWCEVQHTNLEAFIGRFPTEVEFVGRGRRKGLHARPSRWRRS